MSIGSSDAAAVDGTALAQGIFENVWGKRDLSAYDNYVHEDVVVHVAGYAEPFRGRPNVKEWFSEYWSAFPDIELTVNELFEHGDTVVARWTSHQTHLGTYLNIRPTGRQASIEAVQLFRKRGEKFGESWIMFDPLRVMQQLGVLPVGAPPRAVVTLLKMLTRLSRLAPGSP